MTAVVSVTITVPSTAPADLIEHATLLVEQLAAEPGVDEAVLEVVRTCRECGCTDDEACLGGCGWVGEDDLCTSCDDADGAGR